MIYNPYEFLGVDKNVTKEQLDEVYNSKRKQYLAELDELNEKIKNGKTQ